MHLPKGSVQPFKEHNEPNPALMQQHGLSALTAFQTFSPAWRSRLVPSVHVPFLTANAKVDISAFFPFVDGDGEGRGGRGLRCTCTGRRQHPHIPGSTVTEPCPLFTSTTHLAVSPPGPSFTLKANTPLIFLTSCSPSCRRLGEGVVGFSATPRVIHRSGSAAGADLCLPVLRNHTGAIN